MKFAKCFVFAVFFVVAGCAGGVGGQISMVGVTSNDAGVSSIDTFSFAWLVYADGSSDIASVVDTITSESFVDAVVASEDLTQSLSADTYADGVDELDKTNEDTPPANADLVEFDFDDVVEYYEDSFSPDKVDSEKIEIVVLPPEILQEIISPECSVDTDCKGDNPCTVGYCQGGKCKYQMTNEVLVFVQEPVGLPVMVLAPKFVKQGVTPYVVTVLRTVACKGVMICLTSYGSNKPSGCVGNDPEKVNIYVCGKKLKWDLGKIYWSDDPALINITDVVLAETGKKDEQVILIPAGVIGGCYSP